MVWVLYRFIAALVWLLPLFVARLLMGRFFALLGPFSIRANNRMDRSLTVAFPFRDERWRKERRLRTWVNLGKSVADSMKTKAVQQRLQTHVTYRLQPELASLQQDPRGQLLLMGHMGAWEEIGRAHV